MSVSSTVFLGTPTEKTSDGFEDTYLFDVSRVYKGDLASVTSVGGTLANGNGCGTSYVLGTEQLMFVSAPYDVDAEHEGHSCGPATETGFDIQAAVESVYGAGYAPECRRNSVRWCVRRPIDDHRRRRRGGIARGARLVRMEAATGTVSPRAQCRGRQSRVNLVRRRVK